MVHDSDLFNRWQAANTYATRKLIEIVKSLGAGKRPPREAAFAKALGIAIAEAKFEPQYRAELLKLPTQSDVAREIARNVDPALIFRAHRHMLKLVGTVLGDTLESLYGESKVSGPYAPDAESNGRRALRNAVLTLLSARGTPRDRERLSAHFSKADNMTDETHALFLLAAQGGPEADGALERFHERWAHDHLVIDTWFAAQAQSPISQALRRVKALTRHPLFSLTAPNKVRALIGHFAATNPVQFNRPDGAGYQFVADQVLALDRFNPQIAARMLGTFRNWHALEPGRRQLARRTLQRVAKTPEISRDAHEIVSKMLDM